MVDAAAGKRLKRAIHVGRARANILYDTDLALRADVSYDTLMNWYAGKTVPRGAELRRVGQTIGITYADLMASYEGADPEPLPLQDAVRGLTTEVRALVDEIREERDRGRDAAEAMLRAAEALRPLPKREAAGASRVPPAPPAKSGSGR